MTAPSSSTRRNRALFLLACAAVAAAALTAYLVTRPALARETVARKHERVGAQLLDKGDLAGAESQWLAAIAAWPADVDAYAALGDFYRVNHQPEVAATAYQQAILLNPNFPDIFTRLALAAHDVGLDDDAYVDAMKELKINPNSVEALDLASRFNKVKGDHQAARAEAGKAYQLAPGTEETALVYAETFLPEDPAHAAEVLAAAEKALPNSWRIAYQLGSCYALLASDPAGIDRALQQARHAETMDPHSADVHVLVSGLLLRKNQFADALHEAQLAAQLDPNSSQAYFDEYQAILRTGQKADADKAFARFQELQTLSQRQAELQRRYSVAPGDIPTANELAQVDVKLGNVHDARVVLQVAISHHPNDRQLMQQLSALPTDDSPSHG